MQALGERFLASFGRPASDGHCLEARGSGPRGARNLLRSDALRRWPLDHYVKLAEALVEAVFPSHWPVDLRMTGCARHLRICRCAIWSDRPI
jgi:hypothetical protein